MGELYDFQKKAVNELLGGKHFIYASTGSGKTAISLVWAKRKLEETGKKKLLVITTTSKVKARDFENEMDEWWGEGYKETLSQILVMSWHKVYKWTREHRDELSEYVVIWDECQRCKGGISSGMGRAFFNITMKTNDWAGFTGTPGDNWLSFYPYFTACGLVKNKTSFLNEFAVVRTYKGYPEIVAWNYTDKLKKMWQSISYAPDTRKVMSELPRETHKLVHFKATPAYKRVMKERTNDAGEFLETSGAFCSELRRQCFTKDKKEWIKDFVEGLDSGCVFFYNFIATGDELEQILGRALGKSGKVWRIDGRHHEIPTEKTIGKKDMALCQWQSGSEALNLQFLHYWVSVEACYSYSTSVQARGRIRRIGQENPQHYWYLKTDGTIEDDIYKCLHEKGEFNETLWCENKQLRRQIK